MLVYTGDSSIVICSPDSSPDICPSVPPSSPTENPSGAKPTGCKPCQCFVPPDIREYVRKQNEEYLKWLRAFNQHLLNAKYEAQYYRTRYEGLLQRLGIQ